MSDEPILLLDTQAQVVDTGCGELAIKREQIIPRSFIDDIRKEREDSITTPAGEFYRVARIPVQTIDRWYREGFDYMRAPVRDILRKLAKDQEEHWITTKKRI